MARQESDSRELEAFLSSSWLEEWGDRQDYLSFDQEGDPYWDLAKIYPDSGIQEQFKRDWDEACYNIHTLAWKYPKWAMIMDRPAQVVAFNEGGHPARI